jgi:uncharacterized protein (DUF4415 family)
MTVKRKKAKKKMSCLRAGRTGRAQRALKPGKIARLRASAGRALGQSASFEHDLMRLAEEDGAAESRWNRPRKQRFCLRVDCEVMDWFKSKGPGYQTRMNRVLRRVMEEGKKRMGVVTGS